jgi:hypothetical protein
MTWVWHVGYMGKMRNVYTFFLAGLPEGKKPFGRARYRWKDNVK